MSLSDAQLLSMWHAAGGHVHGPHVETGTMPVASLLPFLRGLAGQAAAPGQQVAAAHKRPPFAQRDPRVDPMPRDQLKAPNGAEVCVCDVSLVPMTPARSRVKVTRKEPGDEQYRSFDFDLEAYRRAVATSSVVYLAGHAVAAG